MVFLFPPYFASFFFGGFYALVTSITERAHSETLTNISTFSCYQVHEYIQTSCGCKLLAVVLGSDLDAVSVLYERVPFALWGDR